MVIFALNYDFVLAHLLSLLHEEQIRR